MEKIKSILQNALLQIWKLTKIFAKCVFRALACYVNNNSFRIVLGIRCNYSDYRSPYEWF